MNQRPGKKCRSNGMSASFVNLLKREYVRLAILPDAEMILAKPPG